MKYENIVKGKFINRPNRFMADVKTGGVICSVHVKNTGRCREILIPGADVFLQYFPVSKEAGVPSAARKTAYDLISVYKNDVLINIDSQIPNKMVHEWLSSGADGIFRNITYIKPEYTHGNSRFDFYIEAEEKKILLEVKGVTLENDGIVSFPDAPTERGTKHIRELITALSEGFDSYVMFVIQMKGVKYFTPAKDHDPAFAAALKEACERGVNVLAYDSVVSSDSIKIDSPVEICIT